MWYDRVYLCRYSEKTKKSEIFAILTDEMQLKECSFFKILGDDIVIAFEDKGNLEKNPSLCVFNKKILVKIAASILIVSQCITLTGCSITKNKKSVVDETLISTCV